MICFKLEIYDYGDESALVKPWLENVVCPEILFEEDLNYPNYTLSVEHVFGLRLEDTRQDLFYLSKEELLYISSGFAIIQNIDDYSQIIFGGFENESENVYDDNIITSIAFMKNKVSFFFQLDKEELNLKLLFGVLLILMLFLLHLNNQKEVKKLLL